MNSIYLKKKFMDLTDEELLLIVNENSKDYTNEALEIAKAEIENRLLSEKIIETVSDDSDKVYDIPKNIISAVIKMIGIFEIIIGALIGLTTIFTYNIIAGLGVIISAIIVGFLFLGLSEIISLLHQINERQKAK